MEIMPKNHRKRIAETGKKEKSGRRNLQESAGGCRKCTTVNIANRPEGQKKKDLRGVK